MLNQQCLTRTLLSTQAFHLMILMAVDGQSPEGLGRPRAATCPNLLFLRVLADVMYVFSRPNSVHTSHTKETLRATYDLFWVHYLNSS